MTPQPGDVVCVRGGGLAGRLIRFGAALQGRPNTVGHVAIVVPGSDGRLQCVAARPGGVGWEDLDRYLRDPWTINNALQVKTDTQRLAIVHAATGLIGTPYDWVGIAQDAMLAIGASQIYHQALVEGEPSPNHLVCSSLADYLYAKIGLDNPNKVGFDRTTTPGDWADFITRNRFNG